jgi:hypothetical protein
MLIAPSNAENVMRARKTKLFTFSNEDRYNMFKSIEKSKPKVYQDMPAKAYANLFQITVASVYIREDKYSNKLTQSTALSYIELWHCLIN